MTLEEGVALARADDDRDGGPARAFARPATLAELERRSRWAAERELPVATVGLGSNLLAADEGVDALVLRLERRARVGASRRRAAGRRRRRDERGLPPPRARGRPRRLRVRVRDPGTAGGGVRMNAGAYGSDWSDVLAARASSRPTAPAGSRRASSVSRTATPSFGRGQVVAEVEYRLAPATAGGDQGEPSRELIAQRKATQPTNKRTFGSVFKNPDHELGAGRMLEACGLKGHAIGGAMISPMHANFIENAGGATTADALALMAEARRRAREQFGVELEHEVELLGPISVT